MQSAVWCISISKKVFTGFHWVLVGLSVFCSVKLKWTAWTEWTGWTGWTGALSFEPSCEKKFFTPFRSVLVRFTPSSPVLAGSRRASCEEKGPMGRRGRIGPMGRKGRLPPGRWLNSWPARRSSRRAKAGKPRYAEQRVSARVHSLMFLRDCKCFIIG
jgi:hypothetical protein